MKGNALFATALVAGTASAGVHKMKYGSLQCASEANSSADRHL
jgi:hypothetical protein